jgi:aerotaxis receptor
MSAIDQRLSGVSASEAAFNLDELFYSRTDAKGVITSGNSVFQRVAGYEWHELLGAPHNVVRHPEMPRGLFYFMWERLKKGLPTGAYVQNVRKDGRFYWVFSLMMPLGDGYISIRMKPTTQLLKSVQEIYAEALAEEAKSGFSLTQSSDLIYQRVQELGYSGWGAFQADALAQEFEARARQLSQPVHQMQRRFMGMSEAISQVLKETTEMTEAFKAIRTVPMNMRIIASRLENAGGPISAISVNYSQMLEEMATWVNTFVDGENCVFSKIRRAILHGQFLSYAVALEEEMIAQFQADKSEYPEGFDFEAETKELKSHSNEFLSGMKEALSDVEREARRFQRSVLDMKRYVTGLSSTRMMCKIESATLAGSGTAMTGIVEQLDSCQNEIEERLARIVELNSVIQGNTDMLSSLF